MSKKKFFCLCISVIMVFSIISVVQIQTSAIITLYEPLLTRSLSNPTSGYGYRTDPITGATGSFHYGIDLSSSYGTPVHAAYGGVVKYAAWKDSYGYIVIIYHASLGIYTFYCHLSSFNTSAGKTVSAGDTIAYVGSTGDSTGNHLHFGICTWLENYWPRSYINPTPGVNYNYTYDLSQVGGSSSSSTTVNIGEVPSSKIVTAFSSSSAQTQLDFIKAQFPSGSYFSDSGTACVSHTDCSYDGSCTCMSFNGGIQSKGFAGYVFYCMFGTAFPTYASLPTAVDDLTKTVILRDYTPGSNGGSTVCGMFERKAILGDIVIGEMESGTRQCMVVEDFNYSGIKFYACNTVENNCLVSEYTLTWEAFAATYPAMISIYRASSNSENYTYPQIVMSGNVAVTGISVTPGTASLTVGQTCSVNVSVIPSNATNKNVGWVTSNSSVATIYNNVITAVGEGSATLTATTEDGSKTSACIVTVTAASPSGAPSVTLPAMSAGLTPYLVTPFTHSTLRDQLNAVKAKYPSGASTFSYSCDNGTGSWGFISYVSYCLYGLVYPTTITGTTPTSNWNKTADTTTTLASSSDWYRVGYIHPADLPDSTAATVPAAATGGYFYRNALPGDVLIMRMSNGYNYAGLVESFDAYGITIYTCNIPTYSPSNAVNALKFTWQGFVNAFPGLIQIYRPSDIRKYYYANEPTHIAAMTAGVFTLGSGSLNTEAEYFADYNGILSTQFSTKGYIHPANEIVNLGNVSVNVGQTTTVSFYVSNNLFAKNSYNYLTGLDAKKCLTLSSNSAEVIKLDFVNSSSVSSLCKVTLTIKGLSVAGSSTVYVKNGYGNLGKLALSITGTDVAVTGVLLNKSATALTVGSSETLTATVSPSEATNKSISWSTSNNLVATVSNGLVTAVGAGTAAITVTTADGSKTATCSVTVSNPTVSVSGVSINKASTALRVGEEEVLVATISPSNASNPNVLWSTSDTSVVTVINGKITAVSEGTATVSAITVDGSKTATCTVTVANLNVAVTDVSLNKTSTELYVGQTEALTATILPINASNQSISWSTSDAAVATISNGVITAVGSGKAMITVTTEDGLKTAVCDVTVLVPVSEISGITLSNRLLGVAVGKTYSLSASLSPLGAVANVQWSSSNTSVATVTNGVVSGVAAGIATITASCGGLSVSATVKVHNACSSSQPRKILDVSYYQGNIDWAAVKAAGYDAAMIRLGFTGYGSRKPVLDTMFTQNVQNATAAGVDLGVYYFSVAMTLAEADLESSFVLDTLSQYPGVFTYPIAFDFEWTNRGYNSDGTSYVQNTAYPEGGQTALGKPAASVLINRFCKAIEDAGYYAVIYTYKSFFDNYIDETAISSIDHWVAQYSSTCTYTGSSYGIWQYTSTNSVNGISGNVDTNYCYYNYPSIIINAGLNKFDNSSVTSGTVQTNVPVTGVSLNKMSASITVGSTESLLATISPSNATNQNIIWSTSDSSVVAVSNGTITGIKEGTAIITVTTSDGGKTASCTVAVTAEATGFPSTHMPVMSAELSSKVVIPFSYTTLREQFNAVKLQYPSGSSTFDYLCNNKTGNLGFISFVSYCLYGLSAPDLVSGTAPFSLWNATADNTLVFQASTDWYRVGYIQPNNLLDSTAAIVPAAAVGGYFYNNALPGDVLLIKNSNGDTYAAILENFDAYGIKIYTCNIPNYSPENAVNSLSFTWTDFVSIFPDLIQIYRPSDARKYTYINEPTHIVAMNAGTITLGNGSLNTESEYCTEYNGILSTQFSTKNYTYPALEIVDLGAVSVNVNGTTTITFNISNNFFTKNSNGYFSEAEARQYFTLNTNSARVTNVSFENSLAIDSLCCVTLAIKGLSAESGTSVYITNGYGNLAKISLTVIGQSVPVTSIILNKTTLSLVPQSTEYLIATVMPQDATDKLVTWSSSNNAVATVQNGVITAVAPGNAIITVSDSNGVSATCLVTVANKYIVSANVHYNYSSAGTVSGGGEFDEGTSVTITATENVGFVFDRWIDENGNMISTDKVYTFTLTKNVSLYAMYIVIADPIVTVDYLRSKGSVTGLTRLGKYSAGSEVSLTAVANNGYAFGGWYINGVLVESNATYTFTATENVRIYAKFN